MTNAEAIKILTHLRDDLPLSKDYVDCFDMAISALDRRDGKKSITVETNIYDMEEIHHNCTVQILRNSVTGETSVGWWEEENDG